MHEFVRGNFLAFVDHPGVETEREKRDAESHLSEMEGCHKPVSISKSSSGISTPPVYSSLTEKVSNCILAIL